MPPPNQLANYVQTTLASGCTNVATTLSVVSVAGWPTIGNFRLKINDVAPATTFEIVEVTAVNVGANQVTVTRGMEGTTGIAHSAGAFVGNVTTAAMVPWGILARAQISANQTGITTLVDVTSLTVTVTLISGRRYRVTAYCGMTSSVGSDTIGMTLLDGASSVDSAQVTLSGNGVNERAIILYTPSGDGASHVFKVQAERGSGSGTVSVIATGAQFGMTWGPCYLMVEDIGTV